MATYLLTTAGHRAAYSTFNSRVGSSFNTLYSRARIETATEMVVGSRSFDKNCWNWARLCTAANPGESLIETDCPVDVLFIAPDPKTVRTVDLPLETFFLYKNTELLRSQASRLEIFLEPLCFAMSRHAYEKAPGSSKYNDLLSKELKYSHSPRFSKARAQCSKTSDLGKICSPD